MNPDSRWRRSFARQLAPIYAENPHVAAVILGGSVARGQADRYSDIEVGVFWRQPPTDEERQSAVEAIRGDNVRLYPYDPEEEVWSDDFFLGRAHSVQPRSGVLVEVVHYMTDYLMRTFAAVIRDYDPDELKQNLISGVLDGVALHNGTLIQQWKDQVSTYPEGLASAVVNRHAQIEHFWRWEMYLARGGNLMMLYQSFTKIQQQLLHVLLGLNRVYYFGFKWLEAVDERLAQKPQNLLERMKRVYQVDPAAGAHELAALVEETYDLVEKQLPQVDVPWLRAVFRYRRPAWDQAPPA